MYMYMCMHACLCVVCVHVCVHMYIMVRVCAYYVYMCDYIYSEEIDGTKDCTWVGRQAGELLGSR